LKNSLTPRRKAILNIIVAEYIKTAMPVASETILRNYQIGVSSATIRNDMVFLEKEGYIARPHTSAGCSLLPRAIDTTWNHSQRLFHSFRGTTSYSRFIQ